MIRFLFSMLMLLLAGQAAALSGDEQRRIETRYAEDRKLCADETDSAARMRCLRDAKAEYTRAMGGSVSATTSVAPAPAAAPSVASVCADCGRVTGVSETERKGEGGAAGMIAGGVAGALLGNQIGHGRGRDVATIAGAAGGAYVGNKIEASARTVKIWTVTVALDNGDTRSFQFDKAPDFARGDNVRVVSGSLVRR